MDKIELTEHLYEPNNFSPERITMLGLATENAQISPNYYFLQKKYQKLLEKYLSKKTKIDECDTYLRSSDLSFLPINNSKKDVYQFDNIFEYFYIRNTLYIEELTPEEIDELKSIKLSLNESLTIEQEQFIVRTLDRIIKRKTDENNYLEMYGSDNYDYWHSSGTLVIGVRYEAPEYTGTTEEEKDLWYEQDFERETLIVDLLTKLKENIESTLGIKCAVLEYNDFNTKPLKKKSDEFRLA